MKLVHGHWQLYSYSVPCDYATRKEPRGEGLSPCLHLQTCVPLASTSCLYSSSTSPSLYWIITMNFPTTFELLNSELRWPQLLWSRKLHFLLFRGIIDFWTNLYRESSMVQSWHCIALFPAFTSDKHFMSLSLSPGGTSDFFFYHSQHPLPIGHSCHGEALYPSLGSKYLYSYWSQSPCSYFSNSLCLWGLILSPWPPTL